MMELNFSPRPVRLTTPTMIPAAAHVEATLRTPIVPARNAGISFFGQRAVSFLMKLMPKAMTVAQKTARIGV